MRVTSCSNYNQSFGATLNIFKYNKPHSPLNDRDANVLKMYFEKITKNDSGHLDMLIFDRYNSLVNISDRILFTEDDYMDYIDTNFKNLSDIPKAAEKLVKIFYAFKDIKTFKENAAKMFQ